MVVESLIMQELTVRAFRLALTTLPLLLLGETGTGKSTLANQIHTRSPRARGPFVVINCAAIPDALAESELFGHVRGSFTGALANHRGAFERAHGGTLFLDEVGELALTTQAKLLTALDNGTIQPVGASAPRVVDVRVIAATNRDLPAMVRAGTFREDLLARLSTPPTTLTLPPLRSRFADLEAIARATAKRCGWPLPVAVLAALKRHTWPGNIRELVRTTEALAALNLTTAAEVAQWLSSDDPPRETPRRAAAADMPKPDRLTIAAPDLDTHPPPAAPPASSSTATSLAPSTATPPTPAAVTLSSALEDISSPTLRLKLSHILSVVSECGPVDAAIIREKTGSKRKTLQGHLALLVERGLIIRHQAGPRARNLYTTADAAPALPATPTAPAPPKASTAPTRPTPAPSALPASSAQAQSAHEPVEPMRSTTTPPPAPPSALPAFAWVNADPHSSDATTAREAALYLINYAVRHLLAAPPTNGGLVQ